MKPAAFLVAVAGGPIVAAGALAAGRFGDTIPFAYVPPAYLTQCRVTARKLGYPIPCPTRLPKPMTEHQNGAIPSCSVTVVCPNDNGPWKGWATGSIASPGEHLVITASPRPLSNYARAVDGPGWTPSARVRPITWVTTGRWRMRALFVSPQTNESAFVSHIVMVWTVGRHTYAAGFHDFAGMQATLRLDTRLAASIELVSP